MSAQEWLCGGLRWRVGNEDKVRIWGDRWVPSVQGFFVQSAPMGLPVDSKVSELIDPQTEQWDSALIESCLPTAMAQAILQIPVRGMDEADKLIWAESSNNKYEVRDGYRRWLEEFNRTHDYQPVGEARVWSSIWKMNVPPKVRHFMWRFARNSLATCDKISAKSERRGDACPFCNLREAQVHLFGECGWSGRIWRNSNLSQWFELREDEDCLIWTRNVLDKATTTEFEDWAVLLWSLWKERNAHLFNGTKAPEEEILMRAATYADEYRQYQGDETMLPA
ncbi:unnamed protein product [Linum trigynum]|uniref:Reverse transcriptase zinc-binding domain-containing protein n=1 Tax=Linum trigynum TaxID=586398 RepID=A0AAV2EPX0_9ROSI